MMVSPRTDDQPAWWSDLTIDDYTRASGKPGGMAAGSSREIDLVRASRLWRLLLALERIDAMQRILEIIATRSSMTPTNSEKAEAWFVDRGGPLVETLVKMEESLSARYTEYAALASTLRSIESKM